ncbi:MAG: tRNA A-37 threonylcarbamoyl transferase component Bud32 [Myxococcota bacterium]|jgi:tRNA A-37 threonylcarbamoyl transferase component Bud32
MQANALIANRYQIERRIARGGQASVYLARQVPLDRKVALKVLTTPPGSDEEEIRTFQERFLLEARTLATLDHPNIVTVYDYGQIEPGHFYIAMEFVEGRRFSELLREGAMAPERALRLIGQVCSALSYAHRRKVIHRDIKNSNVLIRVDHHGNEQVKVVDFGIAKLMEDDASLTMTGVVIGSPHFMAPEQARGSDIDHRVDIYAVGVLLYCGLVGRYPFNGTSSREIVSAHISQEIPAFEDVNPDLVLNPALEGMVRRCLAKEPRERFQDVDTLLTALTPFLADADSIAMPAMAIPTEEVDREKRPAWVGMVLAGAALVALLPALVLAAILLVLMVRQSEAPQPDPVVAIQKAEIAAPEITAPEITAPEVTAEPPPEVVVHTAPAVAPEAPVVRRSPRTTPEAPPTPATQPPPEVATVSAPPLEDLPQTSSAPGTPPPTPSPEPSAWPDGDGDGFQIEDNDLKDPWEN